MECETAKLNQHLFQFVNEDRLQIFQRVIENRTRYVTVVLEDIYQTQNASAVLRSCDCFGIQDIHIIENQNPFKVNARVTHGSAKWISLHRYNSSENNTPDALHYLKSCGYRIVATSPDPAAVSLEHFNLAAGKTALVFGSEKPGISSQVEALADELLTIPMVGFTESLNISVSAATIIYQLTSRLRASGIDWALTPPERDEIMLQWLRRQIKKCDLIEKRFRQDQARHHNL